MHVYVPKRIPLLGVDERTACVAGDTIQTKRKKKVTGTISR
jgi:hypothetical protein